MNECLVTKLRVSVNDDSLEKLGVITASFNLPSNGYLIGLSASKPNTVKATIKSDHVFTNFASINSKQAYLSPTLYPTFSPAGGTLVLEIENKYELTEVRNTQIYSLEPYKYSPLKGLGGSPEASDIDISEFKQWPELDTLLISLSKTGQLYKVVGNISELGSLTKLTLINLDGSYLEGSIEGFVAAQRANGRTSADNVNMSYYAGHVTFQGKQITGSTNKVLSWTPTSITFDGVTINA